MFFFNIAIKVPLQLNPAKIDDLREEGSNNTYANKAPINGNMMKSILKYKVSDLLGSNFFMNGIVPLKSLEYNDNRCAHNAPSQV